MPPAHSDNHHLAFPACLSINKDVTIPSPVSRIPFVLKLMGPVSAWGSHNSALCGPQLASPKGLGIRQRVVPNRVSGETIQDIYWCLEGQEPTTAWANVSLGFKTHPRSWFYVSCCSDPVYNSAAQAAMLAGLGQGVEDGSAQARQELLELVSPSEKLM